MAQKSKNPNFDQTLDLLRAHSFDVAPHAGGAGEMQVSKYGAGAVLIARKDGGTGFVVGPGALAGGEVARLLDRGYQKFIKTSKYEIPATAGQLQAIHQFSEELKQLTGVSDFYNE